MSDHNSDNKASDDAPTGAMVREAIDDARGADIEFTPGASPLETGPEAGAGETTRDQMKLARAQEKKSDGSDD